jgi:toxin ParE1/3/4
MPGYHIRPLAARDLEQIREYIAQDNLAAAVRMIDRLMDRFDRLAEFPGIGMAHPELGDQVRGYPVGSYIIYYRPTDDGIDIGRVWHGARDPETLEIDLPGL